MRIKFTFYLLSFSHIQGHRDCTLANHKQYLHWMFQAYPWYLERSHSMIYSLRILSFLKFGSKCMARTARGRTLCRTARQTHDLARSYPLLGSIWWIQRVMTCILCTLAMPVHSGYPSLSRPAIPATIFLSMWSSQEHCIGFIRYWLPPIVHHRRWIALQRNPPCRVVDHRVEWMLKPGL